MHMAGPVSWRGAASAAVTALGIGALSGCASAVGGSGAGGEGGTGATVGSRVPKVDAVTLKISVTDGFMAYPWSNTYGIDVANRTVTYTWANPDPFSGDPPVEHVETKTASEEQIRALLDTVANTTWRTTTSGCRSHPDGERFWESIGISRV